MANTYTIKPCRYVETSLAQKAKHPERVATIHGIFFDAEGDRLTGKSATGQIVTVEDVLDPDYDFDPTTDAGDRILSAVLTMPGGTRGRPNGQSLSASDVRAVLHKVRDAAALDALQEAAQTERIAEIAAEAEAAAAAAAAEAAMQVAAPPTLPVAGPTKRK